MLLLQTGLPAQAVSTGKYDGFVSQLPGVYTTPPDPNVMFTLDDSGSMQSETIPDDANGIGIDMWTGSAAQLGAKFLSTDPVWSYYRSSAGNPLYYDPNVRYSPWPYVGDDQQRYPDADPAKACYVFDVLPILTTGPYATSPPAIVCSGTTVRNLVARVTINGTAADADNQANNFWPATYFRYINTTVALNARGNAAGVSNPNNTAANVATNWVKVEIKPSVTVYPPKVNPGDPQPPKGEKRTDCAGVTCTYAEEIKNFANWFQFYRTRSLMAKGGVSAAFAKQGTNLRVGFATINTTGVVRRGVQSFASAARIAFYADLYPRPAGNSTPLRQAMEKVGEYFYNDVTNKTGYPVGNPWAADPTSSTRDTTTEYSCRRSFHIISTDGFWNGAAASGNAANDNDTFSGTTPARPDGTAGTYGNAAGNAFGIDPFADQTVGRTALQLKDTLADVAAYYWKTDLRPDLANLVVPSVRDPAFWQHLTTYTIGFGVTGTGGVTKFGGGAADLSTQVAVDKLIADKTALNWTLPGANLPETGDDLIHASMNGRGRYFTATNPTDLATGLATALTEAADQPSDFASVAADAPQVRAGGRVYQATFSPSTWYGRLFAFKQKTDGSVNNKPTTSSTINADQVWEASNKMPAPSSRSIYTSTGTAGSGKDFTWLNLTSGQQANLNNDPTLLDYLRGDATKEFVNGGTFRNRSRYTVKNATGTEVTGGVLGDIVNGSPTKGPDNGGGYDRLPTTGTAADVVAGAAALYASTFRNATASPLDALRKTMFLGANDGMLHAISLAKDTAANIDEGEERFAYVPSTVYNVPRSTSSGLLSEKKLALLADPTYSHRFTVDGTPNIADAFLSGEWKSVLVASTGAGARGIYAIDVTRPEPGATTLPFNATKIMWEFSDADVVDGADMGFVLAYPHLVRMRNGKWAVIFGNGADSKNGNSVLFILDASNGTVMKKLAVDTGTNNGLSQPNFVLNNNREVTAIYAGDLKGNLWKFDVSSTNDSSWAPAFGTTLSPLPLFTAIDSAGNRQPISVMPEISTHPNGGALLAFGTGKLFEASDTAATGNVNLNTQSIYGVWDKPAETLPIVTTGATRSTKMQVQTVTTAVTGTVGFGKTSTNSVDWTTKRGWYLDLETGGERVNLPSQQVRNVLFVVANKPTSTPCTNGGCSKMFVFDPITGASPKFAVYDTDADGIFESTDVGFNLLKDCGGLLTQPIFQVPVSVADSSADPTAAYVDPPIDKDPNATFNRGQVTSAKSGGIELGKETSGPCGLELTAARSDTSLLQGNVNTCFNKGRVSWRQLK